MLRERVSNDIYIFTSEVYVQVTAGLIITKEGAIIVDTLPLPAESREMAQFVRQKCPQGVKYIILTHYHADHTFGAYLYPEAHIIGHDRCRAKRRSEPRVESGCAGCGRSEAFREPLCLDKVSTGGPAAGPLRAGCQAQPQYSALHANLRPGRGVSNQG